MAKELRLAWDMDLGPLQTGHRIVGAWLKSASAETLLTGSSGSAGFAMAAEHRLQ